MKRSVILILTCVLTVQHKRQLYQIVLEFRLCTREKIDLLIIMRYSFRTKSGHQSAIGRNALACGKRYGINNIIEIYNSSVQHWYESNIFDELEQHSVIIRDNCCQRSSVDVPIYDPLFCTHHDLVSFISLNCTK
jgi:hypothetical protein